RKSEDPGKVLGTRFSSQSVRWSRRRSAEKQARRRYQKGFRAGFSRYSSQEKSYRRSQEGRQRERKYLSGFRSRPRGRGHRLAYRRSGREKSQARASRADQRDHQKSGAGLHCQSAGAGPQQIRRADCAPGVGSLGGLPDQSAVVEKSAARLERWGRAFGRGPLGLRAREGNPRLRDGRILVADGAIGRTFAAVLQGAFGPVAGA